MNNRFERCWHESLFSFRVYRFPRVHAKASRALPWSSSNLCEERIGLLCKVLGLQPISRTLFRSSLHTIPFSFHPDLFTSAAAFSFFISGPGTPPSLVCLHAVKSQVRLYRLVFRSYPLGTQSWLLLHGPTMVQLQVHTMFPEGMRNGRGKKKKYTDDKMELKLECLCLKQKRRERKMEIDSLPGVWGEPRTCTYTRSDGYPELRLYQGTENNSTSRVVYDGLQPSI